MDIIQFPLSSLFFFFFFFSPQPSLDLGLLHKIQLNFLEASQLFPFLQGRIVSPTPNPPSWRTRPLYYLYPPEAGWLPILVAFYDTHGLHWLLYGDPYHHYPLKNQFFLIFHWIHFHGICQSLPMQTIFHQHLSHHATSQLKCVYLRSEILLSVDGQLSL
jgi:hypothetical protein